MCWSVYIIHCSDESLYTGITTNVQRRFAEHENMHCKRMGPGAKYFYGRRPEKIVFVEPGHSRSSASRREAALKKLSRAQKQSLISNNSIPDGY